MAGVLLCVETFYVWYTSITRTFWSICVVSGGSCVGGTVMMGRATYSGASEVASAINAAAGTRHVVAWDGCCGWRLWVGRWHDSKMAIGSSFHVKITKITNCMRSQITNRGSQNFCDRQFVISESTENGTNSRFFVAKAPHLSLLL